MESKNFKSQLHGERGPDGPKAYDAGRGREAQKKTQIGKRSFRSFVTQNERKHGIVLNSWSIWCRGRSLENSKRFPRWLKIEIKKFSDTSIGYLTTQ